MADFGLRTDGTQNATPFVRRALEAIGQEGGMLKFPKGTYHFGIDGSEVSETYVSNNQADFPKWAAMPLRGMKNVTVDGGGSLFLCHHRMTVFKVDGCENVSLKNLAIDFVRPLHSDSTIEEIRENDFTLSFAPDMTYSISGEGKFRFVVDGIEVPDWSEYCFDGKTGRSKYQCAEKFGGVLSKRQATQLAPGKVRFSGKINARLEVGDRITSRHNNRNDVAIFIHKSRDTALDGVTIHHAGAMGVVGQRSENITLKHFKMTPREGSGRISTAIADATHFSGCKGLLDVSNSFFEGMMDDAINVHGTSLKIDGLESPRSMVCRFMESQSKGFEIAEPGDEIRFIDNETLLQTGGGFGKVEKVEVLDVNRVRLQFAADIPEGVKVGHAIENVTWTPEVHFYNNTVRHNRARGMLFNTPRQCVVEHNFVRTSGSAILVAGDANGWYESGAVGEFGPTIIRNNTFEDCLTNMFQFCRAIISIDPEIKKLPTDGPRYHRDIHIVDNHFKVFDAPLVFARSVDGLEISNNHFERTNTFAEWHPNRHALSFDGCRNVKVSGNKLTGKLAATDVFTERMQAADVNLAPGEGLGK